jgi:hypothetical protein
MSSVLKSDQGKWLAVLEEMGIEEKALIYDEASGRLSVSNDQAAMKGFQALGHHPASACD